MPRFTFLAFLLIGLAGCSGPSSDPDAGRARRFDLEQFFTGRMKAWGLVEPRFSGPVRQFTVDMEGRREGDVLILDEHFVYSDGEKQSRQWRIRRLADGSIQGEAADVTGMAQGREEGASLFLAYALNLKTASGEWRLDADDRVFRIDDEMALNRLRLSKWGVQVAEVTIAFRKLP